MKTVTLNTNNDGDYQLMLQLAKRLGMDLNVKDTEPTEHSGVKMAKALEKLADLGGIKSISNPVEWQRIVRKDRPLENQ